MPERMVVIGGVAAGMSAAAKARRVNREMEIVAYEKSGYVSYGSCGIPYFIKGDIEDVPDLVVRTPEQFARSGIEVHVHHEVLKVDTEGRTVLVRDLETGQEFGDHYDKLILTTGGRATKPPIPGIDLKHIYTLRVVEDAVAVRSFLRERKPERAVIVGGGYIGLEMAEALSPYVSDLTVVEMLPQVLPNMDEEFATMAAEEIQRNGVKLALESPVEAFYGRNGEVRAVIAGGKTYPADLVILSVGVRPNAALARDAGIALGPTGAVAVNDRQETNVPGVYSAGDVAEAYHLVTGKPAYIPLGTTANKQGRVAGENAAGGKATFGGVVGTAVVKVFGLEVARTGLTVREAEKEGFDVATATIKSISRAHYYPGHKPLHVKLVFERGTKRLLGAQMVGQEGAALRIDVLAAALHAHWTVEDVGDLDMAYAPPFAPVWDPILIAANVAKK